MGSSDLTGRQVLLGLDNCEHLLPACAVLVDALLRVCLGLKVVATSRESLAVRGEVLYPVTPLSVPEPTRQQSAADMARYDAVALFSARARAIMPDFTLTGTNAVVVAARDHGRHRDHRNAHIPDHHPVPDPHRRGGRPDTVLDVPGTGAVRGAVLAMTLFPTGIRFTSFAVPGGIATGLFGSTAPFVTTWLTAVTNSPLAPGFYVLAAVAVGTVAVFVGLREPVRRT